MPGLPRWMNEHMGNMLRMAPKNPLDKSTIISIYPKGFSEKKPMMPEWYHVQPGTMKEPSFLVVSGASAWRHIDDDKMPPIEIPISSISVAESVIRDWALPIMEVTWGVAQPGIFFLPGEWSKEKLESNDPSIIALKDTYNKLLEDAYVKQRVWYLRLLEMADVQWSRTNGNPLSISDLMRIAAVETMVSDEKPWMKNFKAMKMKNCPACGIMIMPGFPVCSNCKIIIDEDGFKALNLQFAAKG